MELIMLESISAKDFDPATYIWRRYKGGKERTYKGKHHIHDPVIADDDIYGVRQARSRTPTYQVRLLKEPNIPYRNFTQQEIESLDKASREYKGKIEIQELEEGRQRTVRKVARDVSSLPNKQKDSWYKPKLNPVETISINKEDYQWRKIKKDVVSLKVHAKKSGKHIAVLHADDIFGLRFYRMSLGGYILFSDGQRRNIATEMYEQLVTSSKILPTLYQRTGLIVVEDIEKLVKKEEAKEKKEARAKPKENKKVVEVIVPKSNVTLPDSEIKRKYDLDDDAILDSIKNTQNAVKSVKRQIEKESPEMFEDLPEAEEKNLDDWMLDEHEDFEEDEELEDEDLADGDLDEDEEEIDEDDPAAVEEAELNESPFLDSIHFGDILTFRQAPGKKFVYLDERPSEANPSLMTLFFHEMVENDESSMYRVRINHDTYTVKKFKEDGGTLTTETFKDIKELTRLQNVIDMAETSDMSFFKGKVKKSE